MPQNNCCELCKPTKLEEEVGLNKCRQTLCGCHFKTAQNDWESKIKAGVYTSTEVKEICRSIIQSRDKALVEKMKKYWYHAGQWHNAECYFILNDQGVCNCDSKSILTLINSNK